MVDTTNGHHAGLDPILLQVLQRKGYAVLVADLEDAELLLDRGLPGLNVPDVALLTAEVVDPLRTLAVLQRPGPAGECFGEAVRQRLDAIGWDGADTYPTLPVDCPDLATLAGHYADAPYKFQGYIISLLADPQARTVRRTPKTSTDGTACPPLPEAAQVDAALAAEASPWLDNYIAWSRTWAPRAFDEFHEACGIFVLSTAAARRVRIDLGLGLYTSLYLALTARTTVYTKSTAAELAVELLRRAGLGLLLAADDSTPQAFVSAMAAVVPDTADDFSAEAKVELCQRLAFAAQKGWFYEEFGQHLDAMMRRDGSMAAFRSLLRRLDDHKEEYIYHTISRGQERLEKPYVTLLASLTPADLRPFAQHQSTLWRDGYFARMAFIVPPVGTYSDAEFPTASITYPEDLRQPLREWHQRLRIPNVDLEPILKQGKVTGRYRLRRDPLRETSYRLSPDAREAFYRYDLSLRGLARQQSQETLDGSYGRIAMKALRLAALFSSLHDDGRHVIEPRHWARCQEISERWRAGLHRLYKAQIALSVCFWSRPGHGARAEATRMQRTWHDPARQPLEALLHTPPDRRLRTRCPALLMASRGRRPRQMAEDLSLRVRTRQRWWRASQARGLTGRHLRWVPGRSAKIPAAWAPEIRGWITPGPAGGGLDRAHWTAAERTPSLYHTTGLAVSPTTMRTFWQRHGVRPYRPTSLSLKGDPAQQATAQQDLQVFTKSRRGGSQGTAPWGATWMGTLGSTSVARCTWCPAS